MFSQLSVAALVALSLIASVSTAPTWDTSKYEPYGGYHTRYNELDCKDKHNTTFFSLCCGPLLVGQSLSSRPAECTPGSSSSTTGQSTNSTLMAVDNSTTGGSNSTAVDDGSASADDEGCEDESDPADATEDATEEDDCSDSSDGSSTSSTDGSSSTDNTNSTSTATDNSTANDQSSSTTTLNPGPTATTSHSRTHTKTHTSTPQSTPTDTPSTSSDSASSSGSSGNGQTFSGHATYYTQDGGTGACGQQHSDSDLIGAMNYHRYGPLDAQSSLCGTTIKITRPSNNKSVTIVVADACPGCQGENDIDLSVGAFTSIATEEEGDVEIVWEFV